MSLMQSVIDLEQPRFNGIPVFAAHSPGYVYSLYRRHSDTVKLQPGPTPRSSTSGIITMMEHSGTHVDALCHQAEHLQFYGCNKAEDTESAAGFAVGDAAAIPLLKGRAVLIDVAAGYPDDLVPNGKLISLDEFTHRLDRQRIVIEAGDAVFVRTGYGRLWREPERYLSAPGMSPEISEYLAARSVSVVGADTMAWDLVNYVDPRIGCDLPGHLILLVHHGIFIMENLNLEDLRDAGVNEFDLVGAPLKLEGATGAPIKPLAFL